MYKPAANKILADILVKAGLLTVSQADEHIAAAKQEHKNLNTYLLRHGIFTESQVIGAISRESNLPVIDLKSMDIPQGVIDARLPPPAGGAQRA